MSQIVENVHSQDSASAQAARKARMMETLNTHPFVPLTGAANAHAQTVGARYLRRTIQPEYRHERWTTPDDDFLDLHFVEGGDPGKPTALLLHGLEGCRESTYIRSLVRELSRQRWNAVVMEFRSCGGELNRARRMYHSGETTDLDYVAHRLLDRDPNMQLYVAGFSLGGNVTAKWLGEGGDDIPAAVKGAAVISAPYDLLTSSAHMDNSLSRFYVRHFLRMLIPKALAKEAQHPGCFDAEAVRRARTFNGFDDAATAPLHGFADAEDYYRKSGCGQFVSGIRRPTLLLSAADDPFNPGSTLPREAAEVSPYLHPQFPERGGHVGFLRRGFGSWAEEQAVRFFTACNDAD